jgi:hypothetical protein
MFFLIYIFLCWVMVSFGDPFTRSFVLLFVVPILFHIQISGHPTLSKGMFWTGLKSSAWVMPLFTTDLIFNPPCVDKALALLKVNRAGTFSIPLGTENSPFPPWLPCYSSRSYYFFQIWVYCWGTHPSALMFVSFPVE